MEPYTVQNRWVTINDIYRAKIHKDSDPVSLDFYNRLIHFRRDFIEYYGLECLVDNSGWPQRETEENLIFRLLALSNEEFESKQNYFINKPILLCAYNCGVGEAVLLRFRDALEPRKRRLFFQPYDAIALGYSVEFIESIIDEPYPNFNVGFVDVIARKSVSKLAYWIHRFPLLIQSKLVSSANIEVLILSQSESVLGLLSSNKNAVSHFLELGFKYALDEEFPDDSLQKSLPYTALYEALRQHSNPLDLIVLGDDYLAGIPWLETFVSEKHLLLITNFSDFYHSNPELCTELGLKSALLLRTILKFYNGKESCVALILQVLRK
jgi:hypothetical protein